MTTTILAPRRLSVSCRGCGAPIDATARAAVTNGCGDALLDLACDACGRRALYARPDARA